MNKWFNKLEEFALKQDTTKDDMSVMALVLDSTKVKNIIKRKKR